MRGLVIILAGAALIGSAPAGGSPASARHNPVPTRQVRGHAERLAARARGGDREARRLLVEEHMPLVRSLAARYRGLGLPFEDLTQEGAIGLLRAVDEYDPNRGATFSTYAFWRARSAITHALTARGHILRLPRPVMERRRALRERARDLAAAGREPSAQELSEAADVPLHLVVEALSASNQVTSLDNLDSAAAEPVDPFATAPDAETSTRNEASIVGAAVHRLGAREREIVSRHFGIGRPAETLAQIATDLELSPSRTRALKNAALNRLSVDLAQLAV